MINLHATSNVDVYILGQKTIKGKGEEIYQFYIGQGLVGLVYFLITWRNFHGEFCCQVEQFCRKF